MSTNFYLKPAGTTEDKQHIGKRSVGWVFTFNGQVNKTYNAWIKALLERPVEVQIVDEYGRVYTTEEFVQDVHLTLKPWNNGTVEAKTDTREEFDAARYQSKWLERGFMFSNYEFC